MAFYVKANHKVAEFLHVEDDRWRLEDGNYLLWMEDVRTFGRLSDIDNIIKQIGGVVLQPYEAKLEIDGIKCAQLPAAEDERFYEDPAPVADEPIEPEPTEPTENEPEPSPETTEEGGEA